ncbi:peptidoglycan DD-metalloendopeptidase family protein [Lentiprolixibacter aurantiacus]|uniref:Peptidoglycan DD-metalloendopeptidase family protein n=1 Tax=Lentiprolixibacter aurantiacus TaxID=2993939 RepID=A0AAE3SNZ3_9FLAO|nr:peptidoglycan DD-metalloendopeptidase family protein [Lentiprolixibacter aurantiacus]MCX2718982.1 peptidoglycan DD-metalloendopeptidase family protein [Lentiprolixibacter aurantiacus]
MAQVFSDMYNSTNYDGIYELYDTGMKKAFTLMETRNFFRENVNRLTGDIKTMGFVGFRDGAHVYRVEFDRSVADLVLSLNGQNQINGLFLSPPKPLRTPVIERNSTPVILPFEEEWFVYWGGTTEAQNYHVREMSQQYAYDLLMVKDGSSFDGDPKENESYFAFGKNIIAPCNARVVQVIDGVPDNIPGEVNPRDLTGNTLVLQTDLGEFILFAHLQEGSIIVEEGQEVVQGELMAKCGNSGNSTEPHLHLSLQNTLEMNDAIGGKLFFERILVDGQLQVDYLPVKEQFVKNTN